MGENQKEGISQEELLDEIKYRIDEGLRTIEYLKVYSDTNDYLKEIIESKENTSEKQIKILSKNYGEYYKKQFDISGYIGELSCLMDLYSKKFPDSEILKESGVGNRVKEVLEAFKKYEDSSVRIISRLFSIVATKANDLSKYTNFS